MGGAVATSARGHVRRLGCNGEGSPRSDQPTTPASSARRPGGTPRERTKAGTVAVRGHWRWARLVLHRRRGAHRLANRRVHRPPEGYRVKATKQNKAAKGVRGK